MRRAIAQRPEGSQTSPRRLDSERLRRAGRFGANLFALAKFVSTLNLAETCKNRRLPRTVQRFAGLGAGVNEIGAAGKSSRWVIRGSRLLRHLVVGLRAERNIARSCCTCQSGSPPGVGQSLVASTCHAFEDEDDDENEDDYDGAAAHPTSS
jgi:hypothetical protein